MFFPGNKTLILILVSAMFFGMVFECRAEDEPEPKSYLLTYSMDAAPLLALFAGSIYCATRPTKEDRYGYFTDNNEKLFCAQVVHRLSIPILGLGTVPSHYYVGTDTAATVLYTLAKMGLNGVFALLGLMADLEGSLYLGLIPGVAIASIFYTVEMIDQGLQIKRHNKMMQKIGLSLAPIAWKDRVGMAVQMRF